MRSRAGLSQQHTVGTSRLSECFDFMTDGDIDSCEVGEEGSERDHLEEQCTHDPLLFSFYTKKLWNNLIYVCVSTLVHCQ